MKQLIGFLSAYLILGLAVLCGQSPPEMQAKHEHCFPEEAREMMKEELEKLRKNYRQMNDNSPQLLVLCIQFPDIAGELSRAGIDSMMNINRWDGTSGKGSFKDYYEEVSYGKFVPQSHVYGWYTAAHTYSYYIDTLGRTSAADTLYVEALRQAAAEGVDLSIFDNDGDGEAEAVILQTSASIRAQFRFIWIDPPTYKDIAFKFYTIQPVDGLTFRLGTTVHEYGHVLGLPDLYLGDHPFGRYDVMSHAKGSIPGHFSAWSKVQVGWIDPIVITDPVSNLGISNSHDQPFAIKIYDDPFEDERYFLVENRRRKGYDAGGGGNINSSGLLIYHIDETIEYGRGLLQADGKNELEQWNASNGASGNIGDPGDFYPGTTNNLQLTATSNPHSRDFFGTDWGVAIRNIRDDGDLVTVDIDPGPFEGYTLGLDDGLPGFFRSQAYSSFPFNASLQIEEIWAGAKFELEGKDTLYSMRSATSGSYPDGIADSTARTYELRIYEAFNTTTGQPSGLLYEQSGYLPIPLFGSSVYLSSTPIIHLDQPLGISGSIFVAFKITRDKNDPLKGNFLINDILGEVSGNSYYSFGSDFPVFSSLSGNREVSLRLFVLREGSNVPTSLAPANSGFKLQNFPNPFSQQTNIRLENTKSAHIQLEILDMLGKQIHQLEDAILPAGNYTYQWDATHSPKGIYLLRLKMGNQQHSLKILHQE